MESHQPRLQKTPKSLLVNYQGDLANLDELVIAERVFYRR